MHIFIADLDEDTSRLCEQIAGNKKSVSQVAQIGMDTVLPGIAEGFNLFRLTRHVVQFAVLDVAAGSGPLEIAVELDAVGRVHVDALYLAAHAFPFGQTGHDLKRVAQNHAVGPVLVVLIEIGLIHAGRNTVEIREQAESALLGIAFPAAFAHQVFNKGLGMDFFLNIQGRSLYGKRIVSVVLAAPDKLGVKIGITLFIAYHDRSACFVGDHGLILGGRNIGAPVVRVQDGFHFFGNSRFSHWNSRLTK